MYTVQQRLYHGTASFQAFDFAIDFAQTLKPEGWLNSRALCSELVVEEPLVEFVEARWRNGPVAWKRHLIDQYLTIE
jgi:hypothetical protein